MSKDNRVWIEIERPSSNEEGHERAAKLSKLIKMLGLDYTDKACWWYEDRQCYCFVTDRAGSFTEAADNGHWFNLDYITRDKD